MKWLPEEVQTEAVSLLAHQLVIQELRWWRDVFRCVTVIFYYIFYAMEESGLLLLENPIHVFTCHLVFLPRINNCLKEFKEMYNEHKLRTEQNWSPNKIWFNGMANPNNPLSVRQLDDDVNEEDPSAPFPESEDNNVIVELPDVVHERELVVYVNSQIDVSRPSEEMGIDVYCEALRLVNEYLSLLE